MSARNGDKARFHRIRRKNALRRKLNRELAAQAKAPAKAVEEK